MVYYNCLSKVNIEKSRLLELVIKYQSLFCPRMWGEGYRSLGGAPNSHPGTSVLRSIFLVLLGWCQNVFI